MDHGFVETAWLPAWRTRTRNETADGWYPVKTRSAAVNARWHTLERWNLCAMVLMMSSIFSNNNSCLSSLSTSNSSGRWTFLSIVNATFHLLEDTCIHKTWVCLSYSDTSGALFLDCLASLIDLSGFKTRFLCGTVIFICMSWTDL